MAGWGMDATYRIAPVNRTVMGTASAMGLGIYPYACVINSGLEMPVSSHVLMVLRLTMGVVSVMHVFLVQAATENVVDMDHAMRMTAFVILRGGGKFPTNLKGQYRHDQ